MLTTGLSMTIRGGGDPRQAWLARRLREWACRLGALPLMRMTASWFGFTSNPPNTSVWRDVPRQWRAPLGSSFATAGHRARRGQGRMIALRPDPAKVWRRAPRRQDRFARAFGGGLRPVLTAAARDALAMPRSGRRNGSRSNKETGLIAGLGRPLQPLGKRDSHD